MERGWLGVSAQEVTPDIARIFGLPGTAGALIGGISPHSPADGKLQAGDNLVALAGVPVTNPRGLMIRTAEIPAGQTVPVKFWRGGALQTVSLTVAAPPAALDDTQTTPAAAAPGNIFLSDIGLAISAAASDAGLKIVSVNAGGPAATAGIVADNTVEQINGAAAGAPRDIETTLKNLASTHQPAVLLITGDIADGTNPGPRWVAVPVK
jgi:S1-C subfamily serine protease